MEEQRRKKDCVLGSDLGIVNSNIYKFVFFTLEVIVIFFLFCTATELESS